MKPDETSERPRPCHFKNQARQGESPLDLVIFVEENEKGVIGEVKRRVQTTNNNDSTIVFTYGFLIRGGKHRIFKSIAEQTRFASIAKRQK